MLLCPFKSVVRDIEMGDFGLQQYCDQIYQSLTSQLVSHSVALFLGSSTVGQSAGNSGGTVAIQFADTLLINQNFL